MHVRLDQLHISQPAEATWQMHPWNRALLAAAKQSFLLATGCIQSDEEAASVEVGAGYNEPGSSPVSSSCCWAHFVGKKGPAGPTSLSGPQPSSHLGSLCRLPGRAAQITDGPKNVVGERLSWRIYLYVSQ